MRKTLSIVALFLISFLIVGCERPTKPITKDDLRFTYKDLGSYYYITSYIGEDENITLPTEYKGKKVIGIESSAFNNKSIINT